MWNPFRRTEKEKALQQPAARGGWLSLIKESFTGAWQKNIEVSQDVVLANHAVFTCISLISSDISKMPALLKGKTSDGIWQDIDKDNSITKLLKKPNSIQTRIQFFESWLISKLAHGNTYVLQIRDADGEVKEWRVLDPNRVTPLVSDDGAVFYQLMADNISGLKTSVVVPAREIIHDRFNCLFHPLIGLSPIFACGISAMQGFYIQNGNALFFKNGGKPAGVLTLPGSVSSEKIAKIKEAWESGYSGDNAGRTAVLADGATYTPMAMSAADSQVVEQLKMTAEIIFSTFHVPLYKGGIGNLPAVSNIEALDQQYYSQCLQTLIESMEILMDEGLDLDKKTGVEFDLDVLLRMDTQTRFKVLVDGVKGALLSPNEARKRENMPPVAGGDSPYLQQQNYSLEALAKRDARPDPFNTSDAAPAVADEDPADPGNKALSESEAFIVKNVLKGIINS
ncbi:phage portal protein [Serratia fonticola]|uniref:phage portal protein n=1 Tax=Serratia fonticola TaxID=47917 RepID=UPI00192D0BF1|nr:phage portal protein [Serratia fonticola]MBL5825420.1 phage portal protein [Serratia fonticola]